jgi:hypothetical protein
MEIEKSNERNFMEIVLQEVSNDLAITPEYKGMLSILILTFPLLVEILKTSISPLLNIRM